jgi:HK97 family phage prohead protease
MQKDATFRGDTFAPIELDQKALTDNGEFEGYAATFGNVDQGNDIIVAGAFADSLRARPASKIKMLRDHDTRKLIGVWTAAEEDARGLKVKGRLLTSTEGGREAYELMKAGALDSMSIGYRTINEEFDRSNGTRKLVKVNLMEISVVPFPMNEMAVIDKVKGATLPTERELERLLRDAGFSVSEAKALIAGRGYKSLRNARDAGTSGSDETGACDALQRLARVFAGQA